MMHRINLAIYYAALFVVAIPVGAHAQVVKCVEPRTGKVSYTDGACTKNERSSEIARKQTSDEVNAERLQAAVAQQRLQREIADLRSRQAEAEVAKSQLNQVPHQPEDKTRSIECQRARRNIEVEQSSVTKRSNPTASLIGVEAACGIDASKYMPSAKRPYNLPSGLSKPIVITSCDPGGCWDNLGGRYNGSGDILFGPGGQACRKTGNKLICP